MKYNWETLPKTKNLFTKRSATMVDLKTNKIIQSYSANTKIAVVQKCTTPEKTYYRTKTAMEKGLDWAFEASAFGLPNEVAPSSTPCINSLIKEQKNKNNLKNGSSSDGEKTRAKLLGRLFSWKKRKSN